MTYIIYRDGVEVNRIVADESFCKQYYSSGGYSYAPEPEPEPAPEPKPEPTAEQMLDVLLGGGDE